MAKILARDLTVLNLLFFNH